MATVTLTDIFIGDQKMLQNMDGEVHELIVDEKGQFHFPPSVELVEVEE